MLIHFRINYIEFLKPYAPLSSREKFNDDNLLNLKSRDGSLSSSRIDMNDPLIQKLRTKVKFLFNDLIINEKSQKES